MLPRLGHFRTEFAELAFHSGSSPRLRQQFRLIQEFEEREAGEVVGENRPAGFRTLVGKVGCCPTQVVLPRNASTAGLLPTFLAAVVCLSAVLMRAKLGS